MDILFVQTADAQRYRQMLDITSQTVSCYCGLHKYSYERFTGIKRGFFPWHATYNRIPILSTLLTHGFRGWVLYLDADAYIADLTFDLHKFLLAQDNVAFLAAPDGFEPKVWWRMNAGVFAINLAHPVGQQIVREWQKDFLAITDEDLARAAVWDDIPNDQVLLQNLLRNHSDFENVCRVNNEIARVMNHSESIFIRQVLRRANLSFEDRVNTIRDAVNAVLGAMAMATSRLDTKFVDDVIEDAITSLYKCIFLRVPDRAGVTNAIQRMRTPGHSLAFELEGALKSTEFAANFPRFVKTYLKTSLSDDNGSPPTSK
jgi:hypothetical protein